MHTKCIPAYCRHNYEPLTWLLQSMGHHLTGLGQWNYLCGYVYRFLDMAKGIVG